MKIHLFGKINGSGLETDKGILEKELTALGHKVKFFFFLAPIHPEEKADLNIHLEAINEECLNTAPLNFFIPNPEWYIQDMDLLNDVDLIVCKTHEAERIFQQLHYKTFFLGFASPDCLRENVKKDFHQLFHLRGSSDTKGSVATVKAWMSHIYPWLPFLTVVTHIGPDLKDDTFQIIAGRLPEEEFRTLQNRCGIHLCPSETEGFGHSIMEAMSTKAVVVSVNAPPMNEFITDPECLIPYAKSGLCQLGVRYFIDTRELVKIIYNLLNWPEQKLIAVGEKNREKFLQNNASFKERIKKLLDAAAAGLI